MQEKCVKNAFFKIEFFTCILKLNASKMRVLNES